VSATFEDVYAASFRRIVGSLRSIVGADAEDVANDAFAVAWSRWDEVRTYDLPEAWVRKVARRIALARARREADRDSREVFAGEPTLVSTHDRDLHDAVRRLPDSFRAAVALHYLEDRTIDEVAEMLDAPTPTVKTWLHRARPRLAADVSGLRGRWTLDDPLTRDALAERAAAAGGGVGVDTVMARMPRDEARWVITIDDGRYLMINDDREYFDDGRVRWEAGTIRLRSTATTSGEVAYATRLDGGSLAIRVIESSMPPTDGVPDGVYHTTMFDRVSLTWRGLERIPSRIYRG
jgi:RNA polymerase sigma-70 factor (ECF subfamily)